jgi:hypothetical protein
MNLKRYIRWKLEAVPQKRTFLENWSIVFPAISVDPVILEIFTRGRQQHVALPSHPLPSCPLSSCPSLHRQVVFRELSIHRQAVIVHRELSITLLPSRPLPSRSLPSSPLRAIQHFIAKPSIASCHPLRAVHRVIAKPSIATSPSRPVLHCQAIAVHRTAIAIQHQAIHCQAIHCAELSIASCPSRHRLAVNCSIAMPFFASYPS